MSSAETHPGRIVLDESGRVLVAGTTIKVVEVALDQIANGWSPAEIHLQHDRSLSMAQIHAALAYYYDHQTEFDAEIERQSHEVEALRRAQVELSQARRRLKGPRDAVVVRPESGVRLYLDEHVPLAIVQGLRLRGIDSLNVRDDGLAGFPDSVILDRATTLGYLVYTEDDDLVAEATGRTARDAPHSGIVYAHPLGSSIGQRVVDLTTIATAGQLEDFANRIEYLPL